jgi:hypothetical protein
LEELRNEFANSDYKRRQQILMLSPFTITKTMNFFGASRYLVDKSRKSKELFGILPVIPTYHKGKMLTNVVKNKVISFYEDDDMI